jgi:quercetin dioxygenase-like cupin family protein
MNLAALHPNNKEVSTKPLLKDGVGTTISIQLERHGTLKEHITKTPAILICIDGYVTYEDENEVEIQLEQGDFVSIVPNVKHWLYASVKSQLILCK